MSDMEIKVYLEEADVRKDFFDCKENNLKCPVCGEKIEHIEDGWCNCKNRCFGSGSISLWQELIRTRKALDIAKERLKSAKARLELINNSKFANLNNVLQIQSQCEILKIEKALEQITALTKGGDNE